MRKLFIFSALACVITSAHADLRIQTEQYDKSRVYNVYTKVGRTSLIQLEDDETLTVSRSSVLGMGDADAWTLSARGNNIIFKPSQVNPDTNLIFVTNKRTYVIDLSNVAKGGLPTYLLRFTYPDTEAAKAALEAKRAQVTAAAKAEKIEVNTDYVWRGDNALLKPTAAWDDGRFTRLVYDNAAELPVFSKVLPDGTEALVNASIDPEDKKTVIIQEVGRTLRGRLGNEVIEIINRNYKVPKFNVTGSGIPGAVRVEKGVSQ
jgi:type IV secretion system protein VirB9